MSRFYLGVLLIAVTATAFAQLSSEDHAAHHADAVSASADHASSMKSLMGKLKSTKAPEERKRLLAEHRHAMHEQLDAMRHMKCGMEPGKEASSQGGMMAGGGMMKCHEMTQARMDMMIEMMDQMMQHQDAERAPEKNQ